jgi:hypothetical protein
MEQLAALGTLQAVQPAQMRTPQRIDFRAQMALWQMLDSHCPGQWGNTHIDDQYVLDAPKDSCTGMPDKFALVKLNGRVLAENAYEAYLEQAARCKVGQLLDLIDAHGLQIGVDCKAPFTPVQLYAFARAEQAHCAPPAP